MSCCRLSKISCTNSAIWFDQNVVRKITFWQKYFELFFQKPLQSPNRKNCKRTKPTFHFKKNWCSVLHYIHISFILTLSNLFFAGLKLFDFSLYLRVWLTSFGLNHLQNPIWSGSERRTYAESWLIWIIYYSCNMLYLYEVKPFQIFDE